MGWLTKIPKFEGQGQDVTIKNLVESLLVSPDTIIEIDFTNAIFDLYNEEENTKITIDGIGVKVDIIKEDEDKRMIIALDSKMSSNNLTFLKNLVALEATERRKEKRAETFLNRANALNETINSITSKYGTTNPKRN